MKYYVDPLRGSMANAGTSPGEPWSTLQSVFEAGKRFSAGDMICLARGMHEAVRVTGIIGAPGGVPVTMPHCRGTLPSCPR
jgi:hypothetical protein